LYLGLDEAYKSFNASAAAFLESNAGLDSSGDHQISPLLPIMELGGKPCANYPCSSIDFLFFQA
jgi:hypothetical protein